MLNLTGVSKWYDQNTKVLDTVQLDVKRGEFLYVVGGSGAGKTSLLRLVATEEMCSAGSVSLFGYDLGRVSPVTLRAIRQAIGYIPQNIRLIPDLSVYDNVALSLSLAGRRALNNTNKNRIEELLAILGLASKREQACSSLSGGEAQRVAVARALVRSPELIIADEPTGAQDREFAWTLMELFVRANEKGATVLVATHEREIVRNVKKKCVVLRSGRMVVEENLCFY